MKETEHAHKEAPRSECITTLASIVGPRVADSATQMTIKASVQDQNYHPEKQNGIDEQHQDMATSNVNDHHNHVMKAVSVPMARMKVSLRSTLHRRTFMLALHLSHALCEFKALQCKEKDKVCIRKRCPISGDTVRSICPSK